jgi:hypothetical protein
VKASQAAASGNVPAHAIRNISNNPVGGGFTVDNPQATSGGVDSSQKTVVSQQDLDQAKSKLGDPLVQKVKDAINQKTSGLKQLEDIKTDVNAQYDRKAGDEAQNFNATATANGHVVAVDDNKVKQVILNALKRQVPAGYALLSDQLKRDYKVAQLDDTGNVVFDANGSGFYATAINTDQLGSKIAGKSPAGARGYIVGNVDSIDVIIRLSPPFMPWLPWIGSNIHISEKVSNPTPG